MTERTPPRRPDRWFTIDYPVLMAVAEALDMGNNTFTATGVAEDEQQRSLLRLWDAGYIDGADISSFGGRSVLPTELTERGRRAVGEWPSENDPVAALVDALNAEALRAAEPEARSRLQKAAIAVGQLAGTLGTEVLKAYALHYGGPR